MPAVKALVKRTSGITLDEVECILGEIIPAALNCTTNGPDPDAGRLSPGSIQFDGSYVPNSSHNNEVAVWIFSNYYPERKGQLRATDERWLRKCFHAAYGREVSISFFVMMLEHTFWTSDVADPEFDGDMSMPAAIERAREALAANRATPRMPVREMKVKTWGLPQDVPSFWPEP
jgi:hypothetical protein